MVAGSRIKGGLAAAPGITVALPPVALLAELVPSTERISTVVGGGRRSGFGSSDRPGNRRAFWYKFSGTCSPIAGFSFAHRTPCSTRSIQSFSQLSVWMAPTPHLRFSTCLIGLGDRSLKRRRASKGEIAKIWSLESGSVWRK